MFNIGLWGKCIFVAVLLLAMVGCGGGTAEEPAEETMEEPAEEPMEEPMEEPEEEMAEEQPSESMAEMTSSLRIGQWGSTSPANFCTIAPGTGVAELWRDRLLGATLLNSDGELDLVESFEISEDAMTYVFTLREGSTWHDGAPFTAGDVQFTFDVLLNSESGDVGQAFRKMISSVEAVDDYTVVFDLNRPVSNEFRARSDFWTLTQGWIPLPQHILEGTAPGEICSTDWAQSNYVGLGPFAVADFSEDEYALYVPHDGYHFGRSGTEEILIRFSPDAEALFLALQAGELDLAQFSPILLEDVLDDPNLEWAEDTSYIAFNNTTISWPLEDDYVNQALVVPPGESSVPFRETLDELQGAFGNAALAQLPAEANVAAATLQGVTGARFNVPRTVSIVDEGDLVHWTPIGPESAPPFVDDPEFFWQLVAEFEGLDLGTVVIERVESGDANNVEPALARAAYGPDGQRVIELVDQNGEQLNWFDESVFMIGTDPVVDVPTAAIDLGTRWCRGQVWGIWFSYPCGW